MLEQNIKILNQFLPNLKSNGVQNLINGNSIDAISGKKFDNTTPVDGSFIGKVSEGDSADINNASYAAMDAFDAWRKMPHQERKKIMHAIADKIEEHADEIAVLESYDTGQPIRFMKKAAIRGAANFRYFADKIIDAQNGLSTPDTHHVNYTMRQAIGPVGIITPWNTPFMLTTWKIAPALASGNCVIAKPSEVTPMTAYLFSKLCIEAGLPKGVLNIIHGMGPSVGSPITTRPGIKAISFTGGLSTLAGDEQP